MSPRPEALALYEIEISGGCFPLWTLRDYEDELRNPEARVFEWQGSGFVFYRCVGDEAWIMQLALRTKKRGEGTRLLKDFFASLRGENILSVGLEVSARNAPACALYAKFGFERVGERAAYYKDGSAAWVMRKIL